MPNADQDEIVITLNPDGTVGIEGTGFSGPACATALEKLRKSFGGETVARRKKPEYHEAARAEVPQGVGGWGARK